MPLELSTAPGQGPGSSRLNTATAYPDMVPMDVPVLTTDRCIPNDWF